MKLFFLLLSLGFYSLQSQAQSDAGITMDENETVIEEKWFNNTDLEEPMFPSQKAERRVSSLHDDSSSNEKIEWSGHLSVVKEIPFSEPDLSRITVQFRTLNEIEAREKKKK